MKDPKGCDHKDPKKVLDNYATCERQLICTGCETVTASVTFEMLHRMNLPLGREDLSPGQML